MNLVLNYEGYENHLIRNREGLLGGVQYVFRFKNGYGASVVKHLGSYGHEIDLWELAVLAFDDDGTWHLTYDTPITDDVAGWLTDEDVRNLLERIKGL